MIWASPWVCPWQVQARQGLNNSAGKARCRLSFQLKLWNLSHPFCLMKRVIRWTCLWWQVRDSVTKDFVTPEVDGACSAAKLCKIQVTSFFYIGKHFSSGFSCQNKLEFISANVTKVQSKKLKDSCPAWDGFLRVAGVLEHRCLSEFSKNFTETCHQLNVWKHGKWQY